MPSPRLRDYVDSDSCVSICDFDCVRLSHEAMLDIELAAESARHAQPTRDAPGAEAPRRAD